jgi:hypothetical protein
MELQERKIKVGKYELRIREITVEEEAEIETESRPYDRATRSNKLDNALLHASIIKHCVVKESWPPDFGEMTLTNIRKLPAKYFRRVLIECQKLNSTTEEISDFLEEASSSQAKQQSSEQQLVLVKHV